MKYRKKPVVIEAFRYDGDFIGRDGKYYIPDWAIDAHQKGILYFAEDHQHGLPYELFVKTLEGTMEASVGNFIIKGVKGEIYPCKPDIFKATYDPAE
ncbi:hypothetical protein [Clostridium sp. HBUAS56010]|uniref:hypothetical protein n=1 Tax=Clostridium sp. HBUAS56010 TaxID=2571127 RepID=UPI00163D5B64|nr:hypothetical protein [Clostridium sp. HBUAS56010]